MELRARAAVDPFTTTTRADGPAHGASWQAETARLAGQPSLELWATAAGEWDKLSRPHDAAYCRWRGAQVALATGQGTIALRLLRRASPRGPRARTPLDSHRRNDRACAAGTPSRLNAEPVLRRVLSRGAGVCLPTGRRHPPPTPPAGWHHRRHAPASGPAERVRSPMVAYRM